MRRPSIDSAELLEAQAAADVHSGPSESDAEALLAELRNEYEAFQASTGALIAALRAEVEEKDRAAAAASAALADETATQRLSKAADGTPLEWHLQRAEAALERERATGAALGERLQAERQAMSTVRVQLETAESQAQLLSGSIGALHAEVERLRQAAAESSAAEEVASSSSLATSLEDAERRCAAVTALADKLLADNEALTEIVNQQAALLRAVRGAQLEQQQPQQAQEQSSDACSDADDGGDDVPQPPTQDEASDDAVLEPMAESLPVRQHSQRPRTLLGVVWRHVAGYDDAPQGQVLL